MTLESINCLELPVHSVPTEGKPCPLSGKVSVQACFVDGTTDFPPVRGPTSLTACRETIHERGRMKLGSAPFFAGTGSKLPEFDLLVYSPCTLKDSKTLGKGFHVTVSTTKL